MSESQYTTVEKEQLQPATELWMKYQPDTAPMRFHAASAEEAGIWQDRVRSRLEEVLGFQQEPPVDFVSRKFEAVDRGAYTREKWLLQVSPAAVLPFYLLLPKERTIPTPLVIAFHGHGYGVKDIVGLWETGEERYHPEGYHMDFGVALCQRGFAVAAPEISCFGERQTQFHHLDKALGQSAPTTCTHTAMLASHLGGSVIGLRVSEARRLLDYLSTLEHIDTSRVGAMGISGGGMHAFFSTCLDTRIRAVVVSGYFCPFRNSIHAMFHCACNFVPGLHQFGEIYDLVGLIAPRPLLVESGSHDKIFPRAAVEDAVERTEKIYRMWDKPELLQTDYFEGRHQISGKLAYDFLKRNIVADSQ